MYCGSLNYYDPGFIDRSTFEFHIIRSIGEKVSFLFCDINATNQKPEKFLILKIENDKNVSTVKLDERNTKIYTLYDNALSFNVRDELIGPDGSSWCLKSSKGGKSTSCVLSPTGEAKKRGLEGINNLGLFLWRELKLYEKYGNLNES